MNSIGFQYTGTACVGGDDLQRVPSYVERALVVAKKHWNLDQDTVEEIFRYLNSKDLETMVKAFEFL